MINYKLGSAERKSEFAAFASERSVGLTKREFMATVILQGICANPNVDVMSMAVREEHTKWAVKLADSLLMQLEQDFNP